MSKGIRPADASEVLPRLTRDFHTSSIRTDAGYINSVTIIDDELVVKIPHDTSPTRLCALDNEQQALQYIEHIDVRPFTVPRLIEYSRNPAYLVATYVPGVTLTPNEIRALPIKTYEQLGRDLGAFMTRQAVSAEEYDEGKGAPILKHDVWPAIFKEYLEDFSDPRYPTLSSLTQKLYQRYVESSKNSSHTPRVIHGDLTAENITLLNGRLHGIFDFGRFHRGEIADDLSCLASIDPQLMKNCALELQCNGIDVDPEYALLWRRMKDLHILPYWLKAANTEHPNFSAARAQVIESYPSLNWEELF